jgi:predicted GIY-YIG superfamily endonuclease
MLNIFVIYLAMGRHGGRSVSSSRSNGLRTRSGHKVRNAAAYAAAGGVAYTNYGNKVKNPKNYAAAVAGNSMKAAATKARARNPAAAAFTYTVNMEKGKKYVGMTTNPVKRIADHHGRRGASATKKYAVESVTITPHASVANAKAAETARYYKEKATHGTDKVRGAGYTKGW